MFIDSDEYFLLMDVDTIEGKTASEDDLRKLMDGGIRTTIMFYNFWDKIEKEQGVYDWQCIDDYLDTALSLGYKVMLMCYTSGPTGAWIPDSWYIKTKGGIQRGLLSLWNPDARASILNYYKMMVDRYSADDILVINSWMTHGETIGLNEAMWFDDCAQASYKKLYGSAAFPMMNNLETEDWLRDSYINFMMDIQRILVDQPAREVWAEQHMAIARFPGLYGNGCKWLEDLLVAYQTLPNIKAVNQIYYTWVQWSGLWPEMRALSQRCNTSVFGGAEYAEGLPTTTPFSIMNGLRGQIIGPLHPYARHAHVEPWMIDNLKNAYKLWNNR